MRSKQILKKATFVVTLSACVIASAINSPFASAAPEAHGFTNTRLFSSHPERTAANGGPTSGYTDSEIKGIVANSDIAFIPKFADGWDIQNHFEDAKRMAAAADTAGKSIGVYEYYNSTFWYRANFDGWKPYSDQFNTDWYLKDSHGQPIPFYGSGQDSQSGVRPAGYVIDLANPGYRAYAVKTVSSWMRQAPYAGVNLDSANIMLGDEGRRPIGDGSTWNQLLCGDRAPINESGNCNRVVTWNTGLTLFVSEMTNTLNAMGKVTKYNGIAPADARGDSRNLGLLAHANGTSDESFCYNATGNGIKFMPLAQDAQIAQNAAAQNKKLFNITNLKSNSDYRSYGNYCFGSFMIAWQPGSTFWTYHQGYDGADDTAMMKDQNLNLGNPKTVGYETQGTVLTRTYDNGYVAVNSGDTIQTVTVPSKLVRYVGGEVSGTYPAGSSLKLRPHTAGIFLNFDFVYLSAQASSASHIGFGEVSVGSSATQPLVIENTGGQRLSITNVKISGTSPQDFTVTNTSDCTASLLSPGRKCTVLVTFTPHSRGISNAELDLRSNSDIPLSVKLRGSSGLKK